MSEIWENRPLLLNIPFTGAAGMEVRDLPVRGKLSALVFEVEWTNGAGGDNTLNVLEIMTLLEIVHRGSEVIKSLTGIQHAGIGWRRGKNYPYNFVMKLANGIQRMTVVIPFGRYPYDREYGLTLENLVNPQIRFTWNSAYAASGDAAGAFGAAVGDWSVRLLYAPDDVSYRGYIRTTRIDQYQLVAAAMNPTEMPKNYKWPRLYLQQECVDFNMMFNLALIELQADNRTWVPVTLDQWGLQRLDVSEFGRPELCAYFQHLNQAALPTYSMFDHPWQSQCETQGGTGATCCADTQGVFDPTIDHTSWVATGETKLIERGYGFGRMYCIPFCPPNQEEQIDAMSLDSTKYGRIMLEVTAGAAVGTTPVLTPILEELVLGG